MFTGLVEATGSVTSMETGGGGATRLRIHAPALAGRWREGDSIAVSGVCLTAIPTQDAAYFAADLAEETLRRTTLAALAAGSTVNLELPTPAGSPLGGHVVQGHVDGVGTLVSLAALGPDPATADWRMTVELPAALAGHVVAQGSITINGISLTVAHLHNPAENGTLRLEVAVIPHTYRVTNLHSLKPGDPVNLETDVLAKYAAQQQAGSKPEWLTGSYLMANGY